MYSILPSRLCWLMRRPTSALSIGRFLGGRVSASISATTTDELRKPLRLAVCEQMARRGGRRAGGWRGSPSPRAGAAPEFAVAAAHVLRLEGGLQPRALAAQLERQLRLLEVAVHPAAARASTNLGHLRSPARRRPRPLSSFERGVCEPRAQMLGQRASGARAARLRAPEASAPFSINSIERAAHPALEQSPAAATSHV